MCEICAVELNDVDYLDRLVVAQGGTLSALRMIQIAQEKIFILRDCIGKQWRSCFLRWLGRLFFFIIPSSILLYLGIRWLDGWGIFFTVFIMPQIFCVLITLYESTESGVPGFFTVMARTSLDRKLIRRLEEQLANAQRQTGTRSGGGQTQFPSLGTELSDAYALLGVSPKVSDHELRQRYRLLMHDLHPDALNGAGVNPTLSALAEEQVKKLNAAYQRIVESRRRGNR